ncbi:uncharacterized protein [Mytilus edulis]|uniref:uncharacterized protein n=1 Tax=Mytilus edulis TaxID=6550 RepID=UPI0039EE7A62
MLHTLILLSMPSVIFGEVVTTERRYVTENSSVSLICPFNARKNRMTWRGPPHLYPYSINTLMNSKIFKSNDLQLTGNFMSGEYILVIQKFASLHVGQYQCETTENGVAFRHRFNLFLKDTNTIEIKPSEIMCTNSSEIVIHCTLKEKNASTWKSTWTHEYNGYPIRYPGFSARGLISTFTIEACSFQDIGIYTCSWRSNFAQHNSSVSVDVLSKPVLVEKTVDIKDGIGFVIFEIFLYSNPKPFLIKWYDNDQPLNGLIVVNSTFLETTVAISVYGTNVNVTGYSVFLQTKHMPLLSSTIYKCHIENNLGFINVVFNDLNTPEFESDMHKKSTMEIPSIKTETSM